MEAIAIVGSVASIVQLIDTAAKLSIHLYSFGSTLSEAEEEINAIALEISLFANTLSQLRILLEKESTQYSPAVLKNTQNTIHSCQDLFGQYEVLLKHLTDPNDDDIGMPKAVILSKMGRIKWAFKQKRVEVLRRRLAALQTNLLAMLHTLTLAELQTLQTSVSRSQRHVAMEEQVLRSYIMANRVSISSLEEAEKSAERAFDEPKLTEVNKGVIGLALSGDHNPRVAPRQRDSVWLSAAIPEAPISSDAPVDDGNNIASRRISLAGNPIPETKDYVSRYSIILQDEQHAGSSEPATKINSAVSKINMAQAPRTILGAKSPRELERDLSLNLRSNHQRSKSNQENHPRTELVPTEYPAILKQQTSTDMTSLDSRKNPPGPATLLTTSQVTRVPISKKLPDLTQFEFYENIKNSILHDQDFYDEVSAIEQWFRVLSEQERLATFYNLLTTLKAATPCAQYLSQLFRDWHNSTVLRHFDLISFQLMEKERINSSKDKEFADELDVITIWFGHLDAFEQVASFSVLLNQATPAQIGVLCVHEAPYIVRLV